MKKRTELTLLTPETRVLRFMRQSRKMSLRTAGRQCGRAAETISHYETGRANIPADRIPLLLQAYGYTIEQFKEFIGGEQVPTLCLKAECISLLNLIDEVKLNTVHAVLMGFLAKR